VREALPVIPGLQLLSIDLIGFGDSDKPTCNEVKSRYSMKAQAQITAAVMDSLGIEEAHVVGHSMGTGVAMTFAVAFPSRVRSLFLVGAANTFCEASIMTDPADGLIAMVEDPELKITEDFIREFQCGTLFDKDFERDGYKQFVDQIIAESMKVTLDSFKGAVYGMCEDEALKNVSEVKCGPNIIVVGEHDAIFPAKEHAHVLSERLPNSSVTVVKDAGHSPNWDRPGEIAQLLGAHLTSFCKVVNCKL